MKNRILFYFGIFLCNCVVGFFWLAKSSSGWSLFGIIAGAIAMLIPYLIVRDLLDKPRLDHVGSLRSFSSGVVVATIASLFFVGMCWVLALLRIENEYFIISLISAIEMISIWLSLIAVDCVENVDIEEGVHDARPRL